MPENGCRHQRTVSLPSLASALPKHFLQKLPLLSSEPGGVHSGKKPKGAEGQRYSKVLFPVALHRSSGFGSGIKRISGNRPPLTAQPSPQ